MAIAAESHPFPSRTRKLSPPAPMVLGERSPGRVGRRRISHRNGGRPLGLPPLSRPGMGTLPGCPLPLASRPPVHPGGLLHRVPVTGAGVRPAPTVPEADRGVRFEEPADRRDGTGSTEARAGVGAGRGRLPVREAGGEARARPAGRTEERLERGSGTGATEARPGVAAGRGRLPGREAEGEARARRAVPDRRERRGPVPEPGLRGRGPDHGLARRTATAGAEHRDARPQTVVPGLGAGRREARGRGAGRPGLVRRREAGPPAGGRPGPGLVRPVGGLRSRPWGERARPARGAEAALAVQGVAPVGLSVAVPARRRAVGALARRGPARLWRREATGPVELPGRLVGPGRRDPSRPSSTGPAGEEWPAGALAR